MLEIVDTLPPMHPGEMLREEFLVPLGLTPGKVAKAAGIPRTRIERIVGEKVGMQRRHSRSARSGLGNERGVLAELQMRYDLLRARAALEGQLDAVRSLRAA